MPDTDYESIFRKKSLEEQRLMEQMERELPMPPLESPFNSLHNPPQEIAAPGVEEELRRQSEAQQELLRHLKQESKDRSHDDKKFFWLGALVSLVTSLLVEHGAELIAALQQLFLQ